MNIFVGSDHRGFEAKQNLLPWLKELGHAVEDCGDFAENENDDFVDFAVATCQKVKENPGSFGLLLCGSGVGMSIAANRMSGIYCALGFSRQQVAHARTNDHVNVLSLPVEYISQEEVKKLIEVFVSTEPIQKDSYLRRLLKLDSL